MKKKECLKSNLFPWTSGEKPFSVNEDGYEWYVDKLTTEYARREDFINKTKPLKVIVFFVKKRDFITRVLIGENQKILYEDTTLEGMSSHIDILRLVNFE
jgi:hypothetical protein